MLWQPDCPQIFLQALQNRFLRGSANRCRRLKRRRGCLEAPPDYAGIVVIKMLIQRNCQLQFGLILMSYATSLKQSAYVF